MPTLSSVFSFPGLFGSDPRCWALHFAVAVRPSDRRPAGRASDRLAAAAWPGFWSGFWLGLDIEISTFCPHDKRALCEPSGSEYVPRKLGFQEVGSIAGRNQRVGQSRKILFFQERRIVRSELISITARI